MPLNTQLIRDGENTSPTGKGWNDRDLNAIYTLCFAESVPDMEWAKGHTFGSMVEQGLLGDFATQGLPYLISHPDVPLTTKGEQTLKNDYSFDEDEDEPMTFKKGDVIKVWRS